MTQETLKQDAIETYLKSEYEFQKNIVTGKPEYRFKSTNYPFRPLEDYTLNSIRRHLKADGLKIAKAELTGLINSDFTPKIDVVKEYFTHLPKPNNDTDTINLLADTVITTNQPLWKRCFKKWLVAAVACGVDTEVVNHQILVLVGEQGVGKTTWLHSLLPHELKGYMYSGHINPNNKDTLTTLTENLFINLDELGGFKRNDIDSLKELITKPSIQVRRAYAVYAENYVRRASFMGSVNHFQFLSDDTGNRRFLPFTATSITYTHNINMDEVYSLAYALYTDGFKYWFDDKEIAELQEYMEQYIDTSPEQQLIEKFLEISSKTDAYNVSTATELALFFKKAQGLPFNQATVQRIGSTMKQLGFTRAKHQGVYKYEYKWKSNVPTISINQTNTI